MAKPKWMAKAFAKKNAQPQPMQPGMNDMDGDEPVPASPMHRALKGLRKKKAAKG